MLGLSVLQASVSILHETRHHQIRCLNSLNILGGLPLIFLIRAFLGQLQARARSSGSRACEHVVHHLVGGLVLLFVVPVYLFNHLALSRNAHL